MDWTGLKLLLEGIEIKRIKKRYYGALDEICFKFYPDRSAKNVENALGLSPPDAAVLLTDGYSAYKKYAKNR
jgi:hypothetical protein